MKSSTSASSFKSVLAGLIFFPKKKPDNFFISVLAWVEAGKPTEAYIHDTLDNLTASGIPIRDAVSYRAIFQKLPKARKPIPCKVELHKITVVPAKPPEITHTFDGILVANTKDHHKLNYG